MKKIFSIFLILFFSSAIAADITGKVIKVYDGDTIRIEDLDGGKYKVRLADIDAPEKDQPHGPEATRYLSDLVLGKAVTVHFTQIDLYGRIVGTVHLDDGDTVNMRMVKHGHAWWYQAYSMDDRYRAFEASARSRKVGLWRDPSPIPPWSHRKK